MMKSSIALGFALVTSLSCAQVLPVTDTTLLSAPTAVTIAGQSVTLEAFLWRDFAPISPPDGKPLVAIFRPVLANGATPPGIRIDEVWVLFGGETWNTVITEERQASPPAQTHYEAIARNGPKWGPGVNVTVVVQIRDAQGTPRLLRAADQPIGRTD